VLALNCAENEFVSKEEKDNFVREMSAAGVTYGSIEYRAQSMPSPILKLRRWARSSICPSAITKNAGHKAWDAIKAFFADLLKDPERSS
jgi:hypothetical protein